MELIEQERALGIDELSKFLGVPKSSIYQLLKDRRFPQGAKVGRRRIWLFADICAWIRRREGKA